MPIILPNMSNETSTDRADTYESRYAAALAELEATPIWLVNAVPLGHHFLKSFGVKPRPPHYMPFWRTALSQGLYFAVIWGAFMYFIEWHDDGMPLGQQLTFAGTAGAFFGISISVYYWYGRWRHKLTDWDAL